ERHLDASSVQKSAGEKVTEEYVLLNSLPRATVDAHLTGQIHLEEASSWILKPSVLFHDAPLFFHKGTPATGPPSTLEDALESILSILRTGQRHVALEQVLDHFNVSLAPFIRGLPRQRVQEAIKRFLQHLNWDGFSNTIPAHVTLGLDHEVPNHLQNHAAVGPGGKHEGTNADFSRESDELFATIIESALEICRNQLILNPSIIVRTLEGKIQTTDELLDLALESSAKYSLPNFSIRSSDSPYSISSGGLMLVEKEEAEGAGSVIGSVQLNLPRAAYEASGKDDRFLQSVQSATNEAVKALQLKNHAIQERVAEGVLPLLAWRPNGGSYFDAGMTHGEIGLLGMAEAVKYLTKAEIWEKNSLAFAKKVIEAARKSVAESDARDIKVRVGIHSSPQASVRLASIDAEKFGFATVVYEGSKKYPYYNDAPTVPVTSKVPFGIRASVEGELQRVLDGGALLSIIVEPSEDPATFLSAAQKLSQAKVRNFTFSNFYSRCRRCYVPSKGVLAKCPKCGFEHLTVLTKLGGNMVPLDMLPEARKRDLDRIVRYDLAGIA
ncbi:MAG TPA: anaerobic ribonucleoside-triphosphate reductase, partial [Candidatus Bathyarchaeia archaeon]|nr:anaerobic ribonucleoside-triphosphate reductase [Candidatus Bathyarchaeia archaeon]